MSNPAPDSAQRLQLFESVAVSIYTACGYRRAISRKHLSHVMVQLDAVRPSSFQFRESLTKRLQCYHQDTDNHKDAKHNIGESEPEGARPGHNNGPHQC